jgi:hypothetical protein
MLIPFSQVHHEVNVKVNSDVSVTLENNIVRRGSLMYCSRHPLISVLDALVGHRYTPATLPPGKSVHILNDSRLGGTQGSQQINRECVKKSLCCIAAYTVYISIVEKAYGNIHVSHYLLEKHIAYLDLVGKPTARWNKPNTFVTLT